MIESLRKKMEKDPYYIILKKYEVKFLAENTEAYNWFAYFLKIGEYMGDVNGETSSCGT